MNHIPILTISPYTSNALADLGTINFRFLQTNVKTRVRNSHPAFRSFM